MGFSKTIRTQALVAAARHCCSCNRYKGLNIEVHHIEQEAHGGPNTYENAIPLCFDCHANAGHYNVNHPKGSPYSPKELRMSRANWYETVAKGLASNFSFTEYSLKYSVVFQDVTKLKKKVFQNLFDNHLIAFTKEEETELTRISNELISEKSALIEGEAATGKTIYALQIATNLTQLGYHALYHSFKISDFSENEVVAHLNYLREEKVLLILDDCHLNVDLASRLKYLFADDHPEYSVCILFLSRRISKRKQVSTTFDSSFIDEFSDNLFDTDCYTPSKKVKSIIKKYKKYYSVKHNRPYYVNSYPKIIRHVGSNLIALKAYLELWEDHDTLSTIGKAKMLQSFYDKAYLSFTESESECLNIYLSLSQFEFNFEPIPQYLTETRLFEEKGLLLRNRRSLYFQHSKTASLYLEAYFLYSDTKPKSKYGDIEAFCVENVKRYLRLFKAVKYPDNVNEIVNFFLNGDNTDEFILKEPELKEIVFDYYRNSTNVDEILYFLNKVALFIPSSFEGHFNDVVLNRPIKKQVLNDCMFAYYYASIARHLKKSDNSYFEQFFSYKEAVNFFKISKIVAFKQGMQLLNRIKEGYRDKMLNEFTDDEIFDKCISSSFRPLPDSLRVLCKYRSSLKQTIVPKLIRSEAFHSKLVHQSIRLVNLIDFLDFLKSCNKKYPKTFLQNATFNITGFATSLIKKDGKAFLRFILIYFEHSRADAESLIINSPDDIILHLHKKVPQYQPTSYLLKVAVFICLHVKGFKSEADALCIEFLEHMDEVRSKLDFVQFVHLLELISNYYDPSYFITELDKDGYQIILKKLGNLESWEGVEDTLDVIEKLVPGQRKVCLDWMREHKRN